MQLRSLPEADSTVFRRVTPIRSMSTGFAVDRPDRAASYRSDPRKSTLLHSTDFSFGGRHMRIPARVLPVFALAALTMAHSAQAQTAQSSSKSVAEVRDNRFKWFFGASGGAMFFETQAQTQSGIPTVGAHIAVVNRRGGLMLGIDEAFGSNEPSRFLDPSDDFNVRAVLFDRIRRYGFTLTGYPVRGSLEPYIGLGFGFTQVVNPEVQGVFASQDAAASSEFFAKEVSASGYASLMAGVQFRVGRLAAFGQYQINTPPAQEYLLRGPLHMLSGGLRFSLGSSKQELKGGGY